MTGTDSFASPPANVGTNSNVLRKRFLPRRTMARAAVLALLLVASHPITAATHVYVGLEPDEFMKSWLLLGPIAISDEARPDEAEQEAAFAADLLKTAGGEAGVEAAAGKTAAVKGKDYKWRLVESTTDIVDVAHAKDPEEFSVAYAWAEIQMPEATTGLLGVGSDDGVKVWLNGQLIHQRWIGRASQPDDDLVSVELRKGANQILLKVQNIQGPSGFVCRLLGPESRASKLIAAARDGDRDTARLLLEHGVDVNSRAPSGLTAVQAARLRGEAQMAEFLASRGADASAPIPPPERLTNALLNSLFKPDGPGAAVLVAKDGKVLFEKGYGLGDVERGVPVAPGTVFRIGSITKQFTAAAILKLVEEGKISTRDTLSKFIPDYPRGDEVAVHHLLTHTSGIHSYTSKPDFLGSVTEGIKPEDLIASFKDDPYDFDPGQKWSYNNAGYFLLGYIIEKVSGQSYGDYLRETFFTPLEMKDTGVHEATRRPKREALGYSFEGGEFKKALEWDMSWAGAAGALYSTVRDLYRWNEAVFNGRVLKDATLRTAFTPVKTAEDDASVPKEAGYGYGWGIQERRGAQEIAHGGGLQGFVSYLIRLPEKDVTIAVLVNSAPPPPGADPGSLAHDIVDFYLGEQLAPRETEMETVTPEALDAIVGRYDYGVGILTVTREGDKVFAQLGGQRQFEIYPKSETEFFWKVVEAEVTFVKDDKGEVTKAIHKQGGRTITAPKLEDVKEARVDPKLYDAYVGRYDYGGGTTIMTITREGDRLFAQRTGQPKFEIFPKSETEFFWKVVNASISFVKDDNGQVTKAIHQQAGRPIEAPRIK